MFLRREARTIYTEYYSLEVTDEYVQSINDTLKEYMANPKDFDITAEDIVAIYDYNDDQLREEIRGRKELNIHGKEFDVVEEIRDWLNQDVWDYYVDKEFDETLDTYEYVD